MARRVVGLDIARAVASLIMIQGHAYDGWASPFARTTASFGFTRVLGTFPLPAFFLLAGAGVALRVQISAQRNEPAGVVRRSIMRRGLSVVMWGYAVSLLYALIDGTTGLAHLLRADVLHAIGLSIVLLAWCGVRPGRSGSKPANSGVFVQRCLLVALVSTGLTPVLTGLTSNLPATSPLAYVVALFSEVETITRMPVLPLVTWSALGGAIMTWCLDTSDSEALRICTRRSAYCLVVGLGLWLAGALATDWLVDTVGLELSRGTVAVWPNLFDLLGRAMVLLAVSLLLAPWVRGRLRKTLVLVGQNSLFIYVVHVPFCYGVLGTPLRGTLSMVQATFAVVVLTAGCALLSKVKTGLLSASYGAEPPRWRSERSLALGACRVTIWRRRRYDSSSSTSLRPPKTSRAIGKI